MALNTRLQPVRQPTTAAALTRARWSWRLWYGLLLLLTVAAGLLLLQTGITGPQPVLFAWIAYFVGAGLIFWRPRYGLYLILFLTLVADLRVLPAYPFARNFSSAGSLFYLNDAIIISPLELYLGLTLFAWFFRGQMKRRLDFYASDLFWPALAFLAFVVAGLVYGLGIRGGDLNIGLWEARPILYLPLVLLLANNLIRTPGHVNALLWAAMLALLIKSIAANVYFFGTLGGDLQAIDELAEHSTAIQINTLFLFTAAVWLLRGSWPKRLLLPLFSAVALVPYIAGQRRAAFITLGIALALLLVLLFWANRRLFWVLAPAAAFAAVAYLVIFWNSNSALGLAAQAVRSVISNRVADTNDWASNFYRILENTNISFTIHQAPLQGIGFGNPFYTRVVMPDISFFEWWQYITHNSILWIWMKTGIGGFIAMLTLIGMAVTTGVRSWWRMPDGDLKAIATVAVLYVIMHFTYAYVDMSWDTTSMVYMGSLMGVASTLERVVLADEDRRRQRLTSRHLLSLRPLLADRGEFRA